MLKISKNTYVEHFEPSEICDALCMCVAQTPDIPFGIITYNVIKKYVVMAQKYVADIHHTTYNIYVGNVSEDIVRKTDINICDVGSEADVHAKYIHLLHKHIKDTNGFAKFEVNVENMRLTSCFLMIEHNNRPCVMLYLTYSKRLDIRVHKFEMQ